MSDIWEKAKALAIAQALGAQNVPADDPRRNPVGMENAIQFCARCECRVEFCECTSPGEMLTREGWKETPDDVRRDKARDSSDMDKYEAERARDKAHRAATSTRIDGE